MDTSVMRGGAGAATSNMPGSPPLLRPRGMTDAQIRVIRLSVARTCTDAEFDHFIAVAERAGLDPLRRQISALVFNERDPDKRAMVPLATIDGLRAIAARHGDYRPMEEAPLIEFEEERRQVDLNPLGVVRAVVKVWRRFDGAWFPITGEAWWDEYAALVQKASDGDGQEKTPEPARAQALAHNWRRMGRVLIAKCAEAQALRRGWPEDLSGLYGEEELHRAELDQILGHERARRAESEAQQRALAGSRALLLSFDPNEPLQSVARADLGQRLAAFVATAPDAVSIEAFQLRNRDALRTFWEWAPGDAHDIKRQAERAIARLNRSAADDKSSSRREATISSPTKVVPKAASAKRRRALPSPADQGDQTRPS